MLSLFRGLFSGLISSFWGVVSTISIHVFPFCSSSSRSITEEGDLALIFLRVSCWLLAPRASELILLLKMLILGALIINMGEGFCAELC
jgi:hypothetical protein